MKLFKYLFVLFVILLLPWGNTEAQRMYTYGNSIGTETNGANFSVNATLGADLITWNESAWDEDDSTWTMTTTGPLVHVTGNTTAITGTVTGALTAGVTYQVTVTGTGGTATATYTLGGITGTTIAASGAIAIEDYITAVADSEFVITPANTCTVSITSVTVKALTAATGDVTVDGDLFIGSTIKNPGGSLGMRILPSGDVDFEGKIFGRVAGVILRNAANTSNEATFTTATDYAGLTKPLALLGNSRGIALLAESGFVVQTYSGGWNTVLSADTAGDVGLDAINITAGSGTGITVNSAGNLNRQVYKVTTVFGAYTDTDTTKGIVIATLPAKTKLVGVYADTTVKYIGGAISACTLEVGVTAEGSAVILEPGDVFADVILLGDAEAELGTSMIAAGRIQNGYMPSWSATTAVYATIDTTTANTSALTQGSTTFYLVTERY